MGNCLAGGVDQTKKVSTHAHRLAAIRDRFESLEEVTQALKDSGLESSELVVCIDFTRSNEFNGKCIGGKCLHDASTGTNPYIQVLSVICRTLHALDDDHKISAYGFGDVTSRDQDLFSFASGDTPIHTLTNVLHCYRQLAPMVQLSGPTSFAPAINKAMEIVRRTDGRFHILLLIADGQVIPGQCMENTKRAIVEASHYPLSIIMIGVGDGPWESMKTFDDQLRAREFDNFQFCCFTEIVARAAKHEWSQQKLESAFAISALMEVPDQYATILERGLLGQVPKHSPPDVRIHDPPGYPYTSPRGQPPLC